MSTFHIGRERERRGRESSTTTTQKHHIHVSHWQGEGKP